MEYNISDLLDGPDEVSLDIRPHTTASESRIKELTMKKVQKHGKYQAKRRGLGFVGKLLIAAVLITALAVPVLAASGTQFTDWIEGIITPRTYEENYDNDLLYGSTAKKWVVSGWIVEISAEDSSNTGLTFVCKELGNPDKSGTLTTTEGYWLEKWNGTEYVPMEGSAPDGATLSISDASTERWNIDWASVYGELSSGSYRIGKTFTYTATDGNQEQAAYYAKFRIFTDEIAPLYEKYEDAYNELYNRESYHISWTHYYDKPDDYAHHYISDIWKNGNDYLQVTCYYNEDGSLKSHMGYLLRSGVGYKLSWADGNVRDQVTEWENADFVEPGTFDLWYHFMNVIPAILGEAWDDGDTLYFIEYSDWKNEDLMDAEAIEELNENSPYWNHDYIELAYTFDQDGGLEYIRYGRQTSLDPAQSDLFIDATLEVHDTPVQEIAALIESQNVTDAPVFSWTEDQSKYAATATTEGFVNTSPRAVQSVQDAIEAARAEADPTANPKYREGYDYNMASAYFDEEAQMWKVVFGHSQDDDFLFIVYLTAEGITQMTVYP